MKYLINESSDSEMSEYITMCFINFIDEGAEYENSEDILNDGPGACVFNIFVDLPNLNFHTFDGDFTDLTILIEKETTKYLEIIEDIKSSIEKVKIKYPNVTVHITPEDEECINIDILK